MLILYTILISLIGGLLFVALSFASLWVLGALYCTAEYYVKKGYAWQAKQILDRSVGQ